MVLKKRILKNNSGDSLVEVLLAVSVLALVILIAWAVVNRASNISLAARQRVVMVNALKEQAEILQARYANDDTRDPLVSSGTGIRAPLTSFPGSNPCTVGRDAADIPQPTNAFHFNDTATPTSGIRSNVRGYDGAYLWVQRKLGTGSGEQANYVDFYIRACWDTTGSVQRTDSTQIIVRLNR